MKRISIGTWAYSIGPYASHPVPFDEVVDKLAALGFDVVTQVTGDPRSTCRPGVIVAELTAPPSGRTPSTDIASGDERLRAIPVVAVADDVSDLTRTVARRRGCAAVCLANCSAAALAAGIHAVLGG